MKYLDQNARRLRCQCEMCGAPVLVSLESCRPEPSGYRLTYPASCGCGNLSLFIKTPFSPLAKK